MQNDSIRENLSKEDIVATIKLEINASVDKKVAIVLVEGQDDIDFVANILCDGVICYESFSGKHGLDELLAHDELQYGGIIAIRDKDYMNISAIPQRMFLYDGCCLETMLVESEEVTAAFYNLYYAGNSTKESYLSDIMRELAPYSILRQRNEQNKWSINFQKAGMGDLVTENGRLDIRTLFDRAKVDEAELAYCKSQADKIKKEELREITNGHDLCLMLVAFARDKWKKLGESGIRHVLLCSYRKSDFQKTKLYTQLKEYQNTYQVKFVDE